MNTTIKSEVRAKLLARLPEGERITHRDLMQHIPPGQRKEAGRDLTAMHKAGFVKTYKRIHPNGGQPSISYLLTDEGRELKSNAVDDEGYILIEL